MEDPVVTFTSFTPPYLWALSENILVAHVAPFSTSQDLGRYCLTSRAARRVEPLFARMVAESQHGLFEVRQDGEAECRDSTLAEVWHTLDSVQDRALFDFTQPFMVAVLKPERREGDHGDGPQFTVVDVGGGRTGFRTVAACPPAKGDCWSLLLPLRKGLYRLEISGWRNPHHGILDITVDGKAISPDQGLDWYSETSTEPHSFPPMIFEVETTGTHVLRGETSRCHKSALGAKYWMCLESLYILPAGEAVEELQTTMEDDRLPIDFFHEQPHPAAPLLQPRRPVASWLPQPLVGSFCALRGLVAWLGCPCRQSCRSHVD